MKQLKLPKTAGFYLLILSTLAMLIAAVRYPFCAFSADYGPLNSVEALLIVITVSGCLTLAAAIFLNSPWLNTAAVLLTALSMFALVFSFYTMVTPIGWVIAGLNPFSDISPWVYTVIFTGSGFLLNFLSLFFPLIRPSSILPETGTMPKKRSA